MAGRRTITSSRGLRRSPDFPQNPCEASGEDGRRWAALWDSASSSALTANRNWRIRRLTQRVDILLATKVEASETQVCGPALPRSAPKRCTELDPRRCPAEGRDVNFRAQDRFRIPAATTLSMSGHLGGRSEVKREAGVHCFARNSVWAEFGHDFNKNGTPRPRLRLHSFLTN